MSLTAPCTSSLGRAHRSGEVGGSLSVAAPAAPPAGTADSSRGRDGWGKRWPRSACWENDGCYRSRLSDTLQCWICDFYRTREVTMAPARWGSKSGSSSVIRASNSVERPEESASTTARTFHIDVAGTSLTAAVLRHGTSGADARGRSRPRKAHRARTGTDVGGRWRTNSRPCFVISRSAVVPYVQARARTPP